MYLPTFFASRLTMSLNLAASFGVPHVTYKSSSPDVGAVNFFLVVVAVADSDFFFWKRSRFPMVLLFV